MLSLLLAAAVTISPPSPLQGYKAGAVKFKEGIVIGAPEKKTGIKGNGVTFYVVHVDGVASTGGGRSVDGLYTFVDPHFGFALPAQNLRIQQLVGKENRYRDLEFYRPNGGDAYPPFRQNNSYDFLWKPAPGEEIAFVSPAMKWTNPKEDILAGTYFVTVSTAVIDDGKLTSELTAVDCQEFKDTGNVPVQPSFFEPKPFWVNKMATEGKPLKGVAADGVSMVILRSVVDRPGKARFTLTGSPSGTLHPLGSEPFKFPGRSNLQVSLRPIEDKKYVALALYRPPETIASAREVPIHVTVQFVNEDSSAGPKAELDLRLVRPPVVLVHGTYDNPKFCWSGQDAEDDSPVSMATMLERAGFKISSLDWEETNGMKDPSSFVRNQRTVYNNAFGIGFAIARMREEGIAVTQADLICHSQGGVIARVYARGHPLQIPLTTEHAHFKHPEQCARDGCWYHRAENFSRGDIHRLITISSTHRGSDVCRLFEAFEIYAKDVDKGGNMGDAWRSSLLGWFTWYVDKQVSGITTDGYRNQTPASPELMAIGPTPVPAHALACVATDEDMKNVRKDTEMVTRGMGNYYGKLYKVWKFTPDLAKQYAIDFIGKDADAKMGTKRDGELYQHESDRWKNEYAELSESGRAYQQDKLIYLIRKIVFAHDENDCTVAMMSSYGGLTAPYISKMEHVLHGWAPRYQHVQKRVLELLTNSGDLFSPQGFPDSYAKERREPGKFVLLTAAAPRTGVGAVGNVNPNPKFETPGVLNLNVGRLGANMWKNSPGGDGKASVEQDRLVLDVSAATQGDVRSFAQEPLSGNFDLVVDYSLLAWSPADRSSPAFDLYLSPERGGGKAPIQISRADFAEGRMVFIEPGEVQKPALGLKEGKFRIQRSSAQWTVSQWGGTGWELVGSFEKSLAPDVYVGFGLTRNGDAAAKVSVRPTILSSPAPAPR